MPDWIVWSIVGFIVYKVCIAGSGGSCGHGISGARHRGQESDRELAGGRSTPVAMHRGAAARAGRNAETPIQAAQRRFVQGTTTVEEYEAEVDRALRERPSSRGDSVAETTPRRSRY